MGQSPQWTHRRVVLLAEAARLQDAVDVAVSSLWYIQALGKAWRTYDTRRLADNLGDIRDARQFRTTSKLFVLTKNSRGWPNKIFNLSYLNNASNISLFQDAAFVAHGRLIHFGSLFDDLCALFCDHAAFFVQLFATRFASLYVWDIIVLVSLSNFNGVDKMLFIILLSIIKDRPISF